MVLTAFLASCNELSVVVVIPGPAISFCHKVLCFLPIWFFGSLVLVVACYRAMQLVTVTKGLNCT